MEGIIARGAVKHIMRKRLRPDEAGALDGLLSVTGSKECPVISYKNEGERIVTVLPQMGVILIDGVVHRGSCEKTEKLLQHGIMEVCQAVERVVQQKKIMVLKVKDTNVGV
jgi:hypothetical protein